MFKQNHFYKLGIIMKNNKLILLFLLISGISLAEVMHHNFARICPKSDSYQVKIEDKDVFVYHTYCADFVSFEADQSVFVEVTSNKKINDVRILPSKLGITPDVKGNKLSFDLPQNIKVLVEIAGAEQLFIYSDNIVTEKPDPKASDVLYFKSGQVHEVGQLDIEDNQTVYIEGGAVVRGTLFGTSAKNIRIAGNGVLDGGYFRWYGQHSHHIRLQDCQNAVIEDIIQINPPGWMLVLYQSENIKINNIKQLGDGHGTDGIDIVGSRKVLIQNSMLRNGDDCIVIKSNTSKRYCELTLNKQGGPQDILTKNCAVQSNGGGQAFEIGHELIYNPVKNIKFIDCDVMGVHGQGGVFGIHNCDGATVSDVVYENIRVDHYYNKLIDIRIIKSRWSKTEEIGFIKNITLKDINVTVSLYNPGYSISLIGGYDDNHQVKNVTIENFFLNGKKITNADQLDLYIKQAENVVIK